MAELLYFADPMCFLCWGFRPVCEEIEAGHGSAEPTLAAATTAPRD